MTGREGDAERRPFSRNAGLAPALRDTLPVHEGIAANHALAGGACQMAPTDGHDRDHLGGVEPLPGADRGGRGDAGTGDPRRGGEGEGGRGAQGWTRRGFLAGVGAAGLAVAARGAVPAVAAPATYPTSSSYDLLVKAGKPKHFYQYVDPSTGRWVDTIAGRHGSFPKGYGVDVVGNGERVPHFDGYGQHANMGTKSSAFGPAGARTAWTVEAWVRPDTLKFPRAHPRDGYVSWMGKGDKHDYTTGNREWLARMYRDDTPTGRYGWVSGYTVSYNGGTGMACGQAYHEGARVGEWMHFVYVTRHDTRKVALWINGQQSRGWVNMDDPKYAIEIRRGDAPLLVGTSNYDNWFQGAVAKLAFYTYQLGGSTIASHYQAASSWLGTS